MIVDSRFTLPQLKRTAPNRAAANFYRSAADGAETVGGVPLDSVEAAVVAAVRMGYKIAAAQIDRTERFANRVRQAGDQAAGPDSGRQALDATEQIVFRFMMAVLGWLEGVATDDGNPIKRLAKAEFRILGSLLGLTPSDEPRVADAQPAQPRPTASQPRQGRLQPAIRHTGAERRAVQVCHWELASGMATNEYPITFYSTDPAATTIEGQLTARDRGVATLALATPRDAPSGVWKAAICDADGTQVGYIEIAL